MQRYLVIIVLMLVALFNYSIQGVAQENNEKVVLFPFDAENAGKYSAFADGLKAMLSGRLAEKDGISIVENSLDKTEQQEFLEHYPENIGGIFSKINAGNIGAGVMSVSENKLFIKIVFYKKDGSTPIAVDAHADSEEQVLAVVDMLAQDISEEVFGFEAVEMEKSKDKPAQNGMKAFQTEHPDRKFKEEIVSETTFLTNNTNMSISQNDIIRRKSSIADGIISLSAADMEGNGSEEIFVLSEKKIKAFKYNRGVLNKIDEYMFEKRIIAHAVDISDIDNDGKNEIYISAVKGERFSSMILSWNPSDGFKTLAQNIPVAIRPLNHPTEGDILIGQAKSRSSEYFLKPGVFRIKIDMLTGQVHKGKELFLPDGTNLFDFVYGDIDGNNIFEIIVLKSNLELAVYNQENRLLWISEEDFGGSVTYLGQRWQQNQGGGLGSRTADDENYINLQYIPPKMIAEDINNDGKTDIITVKNTLSTFKALSNLRSFKSGKVVCMSWNGSKMAQLWQTDNLDGYVADVYFSSNSRLLGEDEKRILDESEQNVRLILGHVPNEGFSDLLNFSKEKANLVLYEFKISEKRGE